MSTPPNILFLCTDQQRFDMLGAAGNPHVATPNLDRLAAESVLFENCYVQNPVCSPSRASLMTGQYVAAHGLHANGVDLPTGAPLFSRLLADGGLIGKFRLGACGGGRSEPRTDDGFRVFRWAHDPYPGSSENAYHRWLRAAHPELHAAVLDGSESADTLPTQAHYSRWVADEAIEFLTTGRRGDRPFLLIANFFDPHHGFGAPPEYRERYDAAALPPPVTTDDEPDTRPTLFAEASRRSYAGHARGWAEYTDDELADARAEYYAMVTLVDDEVGRILDRLDAEGLAEDTVVVFTSDHGEMLGDHRLMLKGPFHYDCAVRVPLIVRRPGTAPDRRAELVQWVDLAPTLLDLAGLPPAPTHQGDSLTGLLRGDATGWRDWALCQYRDSGHAHDPPVHVTMLRHDRWKLAVHHGAPATGRGRTGELYDLVTDPDELVNLWDDAGHRDVRTGLQEKLLDVLVATEDRSAPRLDHW
ncbi:sulfatase-like hydrolase/transferase [Pseudonocardia sp. HH130630-07]|uniref:sulfatase-like hydrolase/transferase n=1 Tax=Pseudonocardia sp. HH130630-07 TaxID=1690815 RepID=UPI000A65E0A3|nr:sulfatase-like hydrolase/transferase [Pseudonocardia sp. HH130630-07]